MSRSASHLTAKQTVLVIVLVGGLFLWFILGGVDTLRATAGRHPWITLLPYAVPAALIAWLIGFLLVLLVRGKLVTRHPANAIVRRLQGGDSAGACEVAEALLAEHPHDVLVRLNATAAFHRAGRIPAARDCLSHLDRDQLSPQLRAAYDHWAQTLE